MYSNFYKMGLNRRNNERQDGGVDEADVDRSDVAVVTVVAGVFDR